MRGGACVVCGRLRASWQMVWRVCFDCIDAVPADMVDFYMDIERSPMASIDRAALLERTRAIDPALSARLEEEMVKWEAAYWADRARGRR